MKAKLKRAVGAGVRVLGLLFVLYNTVTPWIWYIVALHGGKWWSARGYAMLGTGMFAFYRWQEYREGELRYAEGEMDQLTRVIESGAYPPQQVKKQYWRW